MERVDYTKRIPSNRGNIEYANTRVPENYDRGQIARHQFNVAKNQLVDFDRNITGIGAFADKLGNFYNARNQYSDDNDLGMDFTFDNSTLVAKKSVISIIASVRLPGVITEGQLTIKGTRVPVSSRFPLPP